jgi:NhaP-type Na+/H+ or K+/H+ antiporter
MDISFSAALLIAGLLLASAAALSGFFRGTVLSVTVLSVAAGIALAATDVISVDPRSDVTVDLIKLALIVTLLSDGLLVERELLLHHWGPPARALVVAMPVTLGLLALAGKVLFPGLSWEEALLLGSVLAATDPVVTSAVVSSKRVPERVRHTLNLESGLNDGLALPFVLFFLILAGSTGNASHEAFQLLGETIAGVVFGVVVGLGGGRLIHHLPGGGILRRYEGIYVLGLGLFAYGLAEATIGNGLIAVFVGGIALGVGDHDLPDDVELFSENVSSVFQVLTFLVFGALIVDVGYGASVPALIAFVAFALLIARPVAVLLSFLRSNIPGPQKAFIAWFGPKGVASMLFALLVLDSEVPGRALIFQVAAFVIITSVVVHGLTDTVGADWIGRRVAEQEEVEGGALGEAGLE